MTLTRTIDRLRERWDGRREAKRRLSDPITHMFTQDVTAFLIPYRNTEEGPIRARCEGSPDDVKVALRTLRSLAHRGYGGTDQTEVVRGAVREIVKHMMWRSYAAFEIGDRTSSDDDGGYRRVKGGDSTEQHYYELKPMIYGSLLRTPFGVVEVPSQQRRSWDESHRSIRLHPRRRTWLIDPPQGLGGRTGLRRVLKRLSRYSLAFPGWTATSLMQEQHEVRFDVTGYSRLQSAYQASAARSWGWPGRDTSLNHWTEYYLLDRTLRFQHALALLRQHVVAEINEVLTSRLVLDAHVSLEGLPSADEVVRIRERMATGELSINEAYDQVR
jgi:hypothetical protein